MTAQDTSTTEPQGTWPPEIVPALSQAHIVAVIWNGENIGGSHTVSDAMIDALDSLSRLMTPEVWPS